MTALRSVTVTLLCCLSLATAGNVCNSGQWANYPNQCPGGDGYYNCCPTNKACSPMTNCKALAWQCCCDSSTVKTIVRIDNFKYDSSQMTRQEQTGLNFNTQFDNVNYGKDPIPPPVITVTVTNTQEDSWTYDTDLTLTESVEVSVGIPEVIGMKVTVTEEAHQHYGESHTTRVDTTVQVQSPQNYFVPPYSYQSFMTVGKVFLYTIPFTATLNYFDDCNSNKTMTITGKCHVSGVGQHIDSAMHTIFGPVIPVECKSPQNDSVIDQATKQYCSPITDTCDSNPLCKRMGITGVDGKCCPVSASASATASGSSSTADDYYGCCASSKAHLDCWKEKREAMICPSQTGKFIQNCDSCAAYQLVTAAAAATSPSSTSAEQKEL